MQISWHSREDLIPSMKKHLIRPEVLLDIGCGIRPQSFIQADTHICCEPFAEYIHHLQQSIKNQEDYKYILLNADWSQAMNIFPNLSVDTIFLVDVVEHLEKKLGVELLELSLRKIRTQIVIFTPLGFMPQCHPDGTDAWGLNGGKWQEHKSGWVPEDFDDSWRIFACKDFHRNDHSGRPFPKPYGAFWAVKTLPTANKKITRSKSRRTAHMIFDMLIDSVEREKGIQKNAVKRDKAHEFFEKILDFISLNDKC